MKNPFIKVWQLLTGTARAKTLSLVALLIVVAIIPLTTALVLEDQDIRQQAAGPDACPTADTLLVIDRSGSMRTAVAGRLSTQAAIEESDAQDELSDDEAEAQAASGISASDVSAAAKNNNKNGKNNNNKNKNDGKRPLLSLRDNNKNKNKNKNKSGGGGNRPYDPNSKFVAATEAATLYVNTVEQDKTTRVGLVTFAKTSTVDQQLTNDYQAVKSDIANMKTSPGTCIECAFKDANTILGKDINTNKNPKAVIFLTDGRANRVLPGGKQPGDNMKENVKLSEQQALKELQLGFRKHKTPFYVIGLGKDVNGDWLKKVANATNGKYFLAPTEDQLKKIYADIADIVRKGTISGYVFSDDNENGLLDAGEQKLPNWTVILKNAQGTEIKKTQTNSDGFYTFGALCNGNYTVTEEVQNGWTVTAPPNNEYKIEIKNQSDIKDKNFGNHTGEPQVEAGLKLDIILHGVGAGGDNPNPNVSTLTNKTPLTPVRKLKVQIFDKSGKTVVDTTGDITYNSAVGNFTGTISLGDFAPPSLDDLSAQSGAGVGGGKKPTPTNKPNKKNNDKDKNKKDDKKGDAGNKQPSLTCSPKALKLTTKEKDVTARLRDSDGKPIAGKRIVWDSTIKGGRVEFKPNNPQTDKNGVAKTSVRAKNKKDEGAGGTITATYVQNKKVACKIKVNSTGKDDGGNDGEPTPTPEGDDENSGAYNVKVKTDKYLRKLIPGVHKFEGGTLEIAQFQMIAGDINGDNVLDVLDYSQIYDCYSDLSSARSCTDAGKKFKADLNDDGKVQQFDYNLFVRELAVQEGD